MRDWAIIAAIFAATGSTIWYFTSDHCDQVAAYDAFKAGVSDHLKAPSTAIYEPWDQIQTHKSDGCVFDLAGYVESQNGFGAMTKSKFTGTVIQREDGSWKPFVMTLNGSFPGS